jgi:hypothetical protein
MLGMSDEARKNNEEFQQAYSALNGAMIPMYGGMPGLITVDDARNALRQHELPATTEEWVSLQALIVSHEGAAALRTQERG